MAQTLSLQKETLSSTHDEKVITAPTYENAEACSVSNEPSMTIPQAGEDILQRLARQVEYYFSTTNLEKDTYVSTLRSLNDGYVPISIIANFGKVRSLVPYDGWNAVRQAANDFSDLLEVVLINSETGKRLPEEQSVDASSMKTVEAVGPISGQPIPPSELKSSNVSQPSSIVAATPSSPTSNVQNTIVLREVPQGIEDAQIRQLFTFNDCPQVQSMKQDVANCWFVTLDTSSRDAMLEVMFQLRKLKFESGEPVLARLKTAAVVNRDVSSDVGYYASDMTMMAPIGRHSSSGGRKNKKKKSNNKSTKGTRNNKNSSSNSPQNKNAVKGKNNSNNNGGNSRRNSGGKQKKKNEQPEQPQKQQVKVTTTQNKNSSHPPHLGEEQFPALQDPLASSSKIEVEKVPDQAELGKNNHSASTSDSSSTATTSTSSSKTPQPALGGYAAALLKTAKTNPVVEKSVSKAKTDNKKTSNEKKLNKQPKKEPVVQQVVQVNIQPPSWGKGSFADILRSKDAAVSAES